MSRGRTPRVTSRAPRSRSPPPTTAASTPPSRSRAARTACGSTPPTTPRTATRSCPRSCAAAPSPWPSPRAAPVPRWRARCASGSRRRCPTPTARWRTSPPPRGASCAPPAVAPVLRIGSPRSTRAWTLCSRARRPTKRRGGCARGCRSRRAGRRGRARGGGARRSRPHDRSRLALLRRAEVVIYDRLVDPRLLAEAPRARRVFAGKASGDHALPQERINALLVMHARRGRRVVRLKGGDPFVFGRGGEEAEALAAAGVPFEIVPGVSAAVAAPAYAGIPLTHRGVASSFAVVTGHEGCGKTRAGVDWARLATAVDTLVVLMGVAALPRIAQELIAHGRAPQTPVALVRWGTTDWQTVLTGRLDDIGARARAAALEPPVVIVIGEVVGLAGRLAWFRPERAVEHALA